MSFRLADFWQRAAARFVDLLIVSAFWLAGAAVSDAAAIAAGLVAAAWEFAWLVKKGATPGKLLMGTKVVTDGAEAIGVAKAALRSIDQVVLALLGTVSAGVSAYGRLYYVTSLILIALDTNKRRSIMDYLANTRVMRTTESGSA